jgi:hypothetical protein
LFPRHDDLDQAHLVDRREEVDADEVAVAREALARPVIGRVEVLEPKIGGVRQLGSAFWVTSALIVAVLEHGFDDQVRALDQRVVGGRVDQGQDRRRPSPGSSCRARRPS